MIRNYLDILAESIRNNWDQPALTDFYLTEDGSAQDTSRGNHYTYGEMYAEIVRVADLLTDLGLQKGDHIAICGANSAHWVIAYLAIAKIESVVVTTISSQSIENLAYQIDFSDAKALFVDENLWKDLKTQSMPIHNAVALDDWSILKGKIISKFKSPISNYDCQFPHQVADNLAQICFTSGSTGISRGVMIPYRSISNNVNNLLQKYVTSSNPNCFAFLQFSHAGELLCEIMQQLCGGKHIFILRDLLTIKNIMLSLKAVAPYMIFTVPEILSALYKKYDLKKIDTIEQIVTAGALLDSNIEAKLLALGIPLTNEYGLTESLILSSSTPSQYKKTSVGMVLDNIEISIAPNGEILVKGENVMLGYYKDPEATAQKIDKDGWLHTGDKGHLDEDGYLYVEGRLEQDIIVLPNGENIRPDNIESLINALPEVKESIVLARDGKLVAIVVPQISNLQSSISNADLRRKILRQINPQLPLFSQLYDVEISETPLQRTEKQTLKRYLYR